GTPAAAADGDGDSPMADDGDQGERQASAAPQCEKQTISYDKYISIVNMLVSRVAEDESSGSGEGIDGDALVQWYLEQKEDELQSEEDYNTEMALAKKVLKKMVKVCPSLLSCYSPCWLLTTHRTTYSWPSVARELQRETKM